MPSGKACSIGAALRRRGAGAGVSAGFLACALGVLVGPPSVEATVVGVNGAIVFDSDRAGSTDLWLMPRGGTSPVPLSGSDPGASDARPAWGPYAKLDVDTPDRTPGSQVGMQLAGYGSGPVLAVSFNGVPASAFARTGPDSLTVTVPAGAPSGPVCVTQSAGFAAAPTIVVRARSEIGFSDPAPACPDSFAPIAFQSDRTGSYDIWVVDADGHTADLTPTADANELAPAWSGTQAQGGGIGTPYASPLLAFESDRGGNRDIYVLDPSRPLQSSGPAPNPARVTTNPGDDANPDWSPNGRWLTFESDRDGQKDIWTMQVNRGLDGSFQAEAGLQKVTVDQPPSYEPSWFTFGLVENPASVIAFSGVEEGAGCEIHYAQWDGDEGPPAASAAITTWTVAGDVTKDDSPAWSPFGDALAFHRTVGGTDDVLVLNRGTEPASERLDVLTGRPATDRHPSWESRRLNAQVSFWRPIGRVRPRRRRPPPQAAAAARVATSGCAEPPVAALTVSPAGPKVGERVTFDGRGSRDPDGPITSYEWDLDGDGSFERRGSAVMQQTYATAGTRSVTLRVTDEDGTTDLARRVVNVVASGLRRDVSRLGDCTKVGTERGDRLVGTSGRDVLCGLGGDDVILGRGGNDKLVGGSGRDTLRGGPGRDRLEGQSGADRLWGDAGKDVLSGKAGADRLWGGEGDDVLAGGSGRDRLRGEAGRDRLGGQSGDDRLWGGAGDDVLTGGSSSDTMAGQGGRDRFAARDGVRDRLSGGAGRDRASVDRRDRVRGVEQVRR